jgi:GxxExxY protein
MTDAEVNDLSGKIIGACIEVHKYLGPGLMESVYHECLCHELSLQGISYVKEYDISIIYKGVAIPTRLRADMLIEGTIILELKSVAEMLPMHEAQMLTYLKLSNCQLGLLVNFNVSLLKDGIKRVKYYPKTTNPNSPNHYTTDV